MPPAAAVYVKVIVRPVWPADTLVVPAGIVPAPAEALQGMVGWEERLVSEPADVDFSCVVHVFVPVLEVAPPRSTLLPYATLFRSKVEPPASVSEETVMVLPE